MIVNLNSWVIDAFLVFCQVCCRYVQIQSLPCIDFMYLWVKQKLVSNDKQESEGRQGVPSYWKPVERGRLECCMILLSMCDPVLGGSVFPRRRILFCKHVEPINNELLLCSNGEELMGEWQLSTYMCEVLSSSGVVVGVHSTWCAV